MMSSVIEKRPNSAVRSGMFAVFIAFVIYFSSLHGAGHEMEDRLEVAVYTPRWKRKLTKEFISEIRIEKAKPSPFGGHIGPIELPKELWGEVLERFSDYNYAHEIVASGHEACLIVILDGKEQIISLQWEADNHRPFSFTLNGIHCRQSDNRRETNASMGAWVEDLITRAKN